MKNIEEIRSEIEYLIEKNFTPSDSNYNSFLDRFEPRNYFQDICDDDSYENYDLDMFQHDVYKSYTDWYYDYLTEKYLEKSDCELIDMFGYMEDIDEIKLDDLIEEHDFITWWDECQDEFKPVHYVIEENEEYA